MTKNKDQSIFEVDIDYTAYFIFGMIILYIFGIMSIYNHTNINIIMSIIGYIIAMISLLCISVN